VYFFAGFTLDFAEAKSTRRAVKRGIPKFFKILGNIPLASDGDTKVGSKAVDICGRASGHGPLWHGP